MGKLGWGKTGRGAKQSRWGGGMGRITRETAGGGDGEDN